MPNRSVVAAACALLVGALPAHAELSLSRFFKRNTPPAPTAPSTPSAPPAEAMPPSPASPPRLLRVIKIDPANPNLRLIDEPSVSAAEAAPAAVELIPAEPLPAAKPAVPMANGAAPVGTVEAADGKIFPPETRSAARAVSRPGEPVAMIPPTKDRRELTNGCEAMLLRQEALEVVKPLVPVERMLERIEKDLSVKPFSVKRTPKSEVTVRARREALESIKSPPYSVRFVRGVKRQVGGRVQTMWRVLRGQAEVEEVPDYEYDWEESKLVFFRHAASDRLSREYVKRLGHYAELAKQGLLPGFEVSPVESYGPKYSISPFVEGRLLADRWLGQYNPLVGMAWLVGWAGPQDFALGQLWQEFRERLSAVEEGLLQQGYTITGKQVGRESWTAMLKTGLRAEKKNEDGSVSVVAINALNTWVTIDGTFMIIDGQ